MLPLYASPSDATPKPPRAAWEVAEPEVARDGAPMPEVENAPLSLDSALSRGRVRREGALVASRGHIRALVLPVTLGGASPEWSEEEIAERVFGRAGLAGEVLQLSEGTARLQADIFPPLIDAAMDAADITESIDAEVNLRALAERLVGEWSRRANLAQYDSDGADERPMSKDDDGRIDLIYVLIETRGYPALLSVGLDKEVAVGRAGRLTLRATAAHVLPVGSKSEDPPLPLATRVLQYLSSTGIHPQVALFPRPFDTELSTATRVELGWSEHVSVSAPGSYTLSRGTLILPVRPGDSRQSWMIERRAGRVLLSDVRRSDGQAETLVVRDLTDSAMPVSISLEGDREARLSWDEREFHLEIIGGR